MPFFAVAFGVGLAATLLGRLTLSGQCGGNAIVCENANPGTPASQWDIAGAGDSQIQGFATDISVAPGDTVHFKVDTTANAFSMKIYRMGYYGGLGARQMATVSPTVATDQPACLEQAATGLIDCGNWLESASWQVPVTAVSGIYFAKITRLNGTTETGGGSHITFVVRDDTGGSDLLFQTSDTTWQAYNSYGGNSLYTGTPGTNPGRAYKVSYNRPFITRNGSENHDWVFYAEYPMVRFLEANGYDVSYASGVDTDRRGSSALLQHRVFMSVGHDEYWSGGQRANVETARNGGVNLAFFSGNEIFWKTRWENSIDGSGTPYRTLVCYKETHANAKIDPLGSVWTGTWRDPRPFNPEGGKPENAVTGTIFMVNEGATTAIEVPAAYSPLRFWRNTTVASLQPGQTATLPANTLGYEWDANLDNGFRPAGLIELSRKTDTNTSVLQDFGSSYGSGTVTHNLSLYRQANGALVFGAGTVQWSWGLDATHDVGNLTAPAADLRMQQATVNLLADMGAQPLTLRPGLSPASASTDTVAPSSAITSPSNGATLAAGSTVTITGTATDVGGGVVAGVDVSVDGGLTWHRAVGTTSWSFAWTPSSNGPATIRSRAFDDSGFVESPSAGISVTVGGSGGGNCPCSIWPASAVPANPGANDGSAVELGVKFRSSTAGYITGIRYYKSAQNTGTHLGHLWSSGGTLLASATFAGESSTGWQQVTFASPVAIAANTIYVASYHTSTGFYAGDNDFFVSSVTNGPLTAPADGINGGNGVFVYGAGGFPSETWRSSNYWVDVVFVTNIGPDTTPPAVVSVSPVNGASGVATTTAVSVAFNEPLDPATIGPSTVELRDPASNLVASNVTWSSGSQTVTVTPTSGLLNSTSYSLKVRGGTVDPRVKDVAGNALASDFTSTFTTAAPPPPPPDQGPGGPILIISSASNPFTRYYAEILRTEGLNAFLVKDISTVTAATLDSYDVVILGQMPLNAAQVTMLTDWVNGGGNLIAMRPDTQLAGLLGLSETGTTLPEAYLLVDTSKAPGAGIVGQTIQFHGIADRYALNGASSIATLYSSPSNVTANPAITLRSVGAGRAAAFTYDLARSVAQTRQGNPAWAGQERDGVSPIRSDDLFFGASANDPQTDWVNLNKVAVPQADEQQRLLANLIGFMNLTRKPLPRFWYFPRGKKAVIVMTGDDHGNNGTSGRFDIYKSFSPANCSVADWECIRSTSYIYPGTPISDAQAAAYQSDGFEIGVHVTTGCNDYTPASLEANFSSQLADLANQLPSISSPRTNRTHCIAWSDYTTQAQVSLAHGIRFDTNYYYWPPAWNQDRPGFFTGSGMPMRFATANGDLIDVYQATTQMTDESQQSYPFTPDTLLDRALGPEGYYGAFTANMHTDNANIPESDAIIQSAIAHNVPVVSATQMLTWLDGRNGSSFGNIGWAGSTLSFTVSVGAGANRLYTMVPTNSAVGVLSGLTRNGAAVAYSTETIKGVAYAIFESGAGNYQAVYGGAAPTPTLSINSVSVAEGNSGTSNAVFTVTLSAPTSQDVTVGYATANGTATAGSDYTDGSGSLLFPAGTTSQNISVPIIGDTTVEPNETFTVTLSNATNATILQGTGTGTIVDDDSVSGLSINNVTLAEGNSGTTNAVFTVTLSPSSGQTVTVNYGTANGSATAGSDYSSTSGQLTFGPGTTSQTVAVPIIGDAIIEPNETFTVQLSNPVNATLAQSTGTGTITNDDVPALSINSVTVTEGNSGTTNATFAVTLSAPGSQTVTVNYATANGTATSPSDFAAASGTLTFLAGEVSKNVIVQVNGDAVAESNETFTVTLSGATNATIAQGVGTGTITNDDGAVPSISIADLSVNEGNSGTTNAVLTLTLSAPSAGTVTVNYATANGSATAASDYTAVTTATATFAANSTTTTISIPVIGDTTVEPNETFFVNLTSPVNATIADAQAVVTIVNDDLPALTIGNRTVTEGNSGSVSAAFTVTLTPASTNTVTVSYATAPGTASASIDYTTTSGSLTFAPGETTKTINVPVLGDTLDEANETYSVNLSAPVNARLGTPASGTGTITDDDPSSALRIGDVTVTEGNSGTVAAVFNVTLTPAAGRTVTVNYATGNGTATAGSGDYASTSGTLTFLAGETAKTVTVLVNGDVGDEADETFNVNLSNASAATIADSQGVGTILDDDPTPTVSIGDTSVVESNLLTTRTATFTLTLSAASNRTITVNYATANGTATAGLDYTAKSGTVTFNAGVTTRTVTVTVTGDITREGNETFLVNLSSPSNVVIADGQGVCTIIDND